MEPMSWGAAIGGLITIVVAIIGFFQYKRVTRDKLAQAEVDELQDQMDHPTVEPDPAKRLFINKPKT